MPATFERSGRLVMTKPPETYTEAETEARREAALKVMLASPHKPHKVTPAAGKDRGRKSTQS